MISKLSTTNGGTWYILKESGTDDAFPKRVVKSADINVCFHFFKNTKNASTSYRVIAFASKNIQHGDYLCYR